MAEITKELLLQKKAEYERQRTIHINNASAANGAMEAIDSLITAMDAPPAEPTTEAK